MSTETLSLASHGPVIPVIVIQKLEHAVPLAEALVAGGVKVLEVTLRTPAALQAMEAMARAVPEAIVGAGTLRTAADVQAAKNAGCRFGVSPGYTDALAAACKEVGLPLLPGVSTASEVMQASSAGFQFLKLFPAVAVGGVNLLKALSGPFPDIAFCPTGGITPETAPQFLSLPNVKVCGGSWLTPQDAMDAGDWGRITALAKAASALR
ncbi:bifunctional 4-hydroxy-2-oxoglutarate aldolase/2-dehydro-3-deoxy-phosphogluconate aldolase [Pelomonas sp. V22]|uniref:bifunctional 4-hydroxy-2-oxoglutarate aldolase/2-dehydro-3-deoxy-phosphogluconate aldolase n=1 Tax=Pelomonas sp. V22 TaxID=2822139 RepID=UPI0024A997AA|nr:bifunctional 4-hydroxy-2-oxoglutarate aldolase/2-dehydro-3-deoxy-phosphogluconate aldolase [Pelomonas sp. V22]MDI4631491.1 bifunctional 4-hydroxy-2-oxoglutarate aldolase/2-dehydro-3-deoxy-phosphogluconate aldolase [Pelomonas sp. V22]